MLHDFLLIVIAVTTSFFFTIVCVGTLKIEIKKYIETTDATLRNTWDMILKVAWKK